MRKGLVTVLALVAALVAIVVVAGGCVPAGTDTGQTQGGAMPLIIMMVALFGMFYFLMIRPVRQRTKKHEEMMQQLNRGDFVVTAGGIYGQIESIDEDSIVLKVESGALLRVSKGGVIGRRGETEQRAA